MSELVILLCPCCASTIDAQPAEDPQNFECVSCGQQWSMVVDQDRQAAHALH